jgi:hypothetical protein
MHKEMNPYNFLFVVMFYMMALETKIVNIEKGMPELFG